MEKRIMLPDENSVKEIFCRHLKELRREQNLMQSDVAFCLGIPVSTYANWEQGRTEPSIYDLYKLITFFELDPGELFQL